MAGPRRPGTIGGSSTGRRNGSTISGPACHDGGARDTAGELGGRTLSHREPSGSIHRATTRPGAIDAPPLDATEELLVVLRGIGSVMFLTSARIIVARDGMERRPRTGLQSFPLGQLDRVRIDVGSGPSGRIVVWAAGELEAVSMFFEAKSRDRAEELVAAASAGIARARRRAPGSTRRRVHGRI